MGLQQIDKTFIKENGKDIPPFILKLVFRYIFWLFSFFSHKIIVHENFQKQELINDYHISEKKISIIPHGVPEVVEFIQKSREKLRLPKNKKIYLYMGYAAKYKGLPELYDICKNYLKKNDVIFLIGAWPSPYLKNDNNYKIWYSELKQKFESLGKHVRWLWFIDGTMIPAYYSASDAILFPYSRRLAASGPMAIAIGYEKNIVLSSILEGEKKFIFDINKIVCTRDLKTSRTWGIIAEKTIKVYSK